MSSQKAFASTGDMAEKKISFTQVGPDLFAFTAQGDPNTGVIIGDDCCAVFDAQATPAMAHSVSKRYEPLLISRSSTLYCRIITLSASWARRASIRKVSSRLKKPIASLLSEGSRIGNRNTAVFRDCSRMRKAFPALRGQRTPSKAR